VLTTCQPSIVWCSRERLPAAAAQPAKVRQSCSATDLFIYLRDAKGHIWAVVMMMMMMMGVNNRFCPKAISQW
jgi:hypothetical protein